VNRLELEIGIVARRDEDGTLDELFMHSRGEVVFHGWWIGPPGSDPALRAPLREGEDQ